MIKRVCAECKFYRCISVMCFRDLTPDFKIDHQCLRPYDPVVNLVTGEVPQHPALDAMQERYNYDPADIDHCGSMGRYWTEKTEDKAESEVIESEEDE